jgi:transcriptional regulator of acetoin/glycerol metabolism
LTAEAVRLLQSYLWPGNVRELRNVLERVVIETETEAISAKAFAEWIRERQRFSVSASGALPAEQDRDLPILLAPSAPASESPRWQRAAGQPVDLTAADIRNAYRAAQGNLSAAARLLGIHRATLYRHLKRLDLDRDSLS